MDRSYRILPTYTGDVSGAASALYELGGMVVIHDPSGCNSTYNTHDETRWYDRESLIFITGLSARDAVLGNDDKLIKDVCDTADYYRPAFIALVSSPIPYLNGTDFPALARIIERRSGIRTFFVATNGMHDYVRGAGNALLKIAENFVEKPVEPSRGPESSAGPAANCRLKVNILGLTPLDFAVEGAVDRLQAILAQHGFDVLTRWAMDSTLDELRRSAEADVDLVVSAAGLQTAHFLEKTFGIPFVAGLPVGGFTEALMEALAEAAGSGRSALPCRDFRRAQASSLTHACVIGEAVAAGSYAAAMELATGKAFRVITSLEDSAELLGPRDLFVSGEEAVEDALKEMELVAGDDFYEAVCPAGCDFISLPHLAFSGRNAVRDLKTMEPYDIEKLLAGRHLLP